MEEIKTGPSVLELVRNYPINSVTSSSKNKSEALYAFIQKAANKNVFEYESGTFNLNAFLSLEDLKGRSNLDQSVIDLISKSYNSKLAADRLFGSFLNAVATGGKLVFTLSAIHIPTLLRNDPNTNNKSEAMGGSRRSQLLESLESRGVFEWVQRPVKGSNGQKGVIKINPELFALALPDLTEEEQKDVLAKQLPKAIKWASRSETTEEIEVSKVAELVPPVEEASQIIPIQRGGGLPSPEEVRVCFEDSPEEDFTEVTKNYIKEINVNSTKDPRGSVKELSEADRRKNSIKTAMRYLKNRDECDNKNVKSLSTQDQQSSSRIYYSLSSDLLHHVLELDENLSWLIQNDSIEGIDLSNLEKYEETFNRIMSEKADMAVNG